MKLYQNPFSSNSRRALAVAYHLGIELETPLVDLSKGDHRKPEYLKINPNGMVPTLVDDDFILWESVAIMQYLARGRAGNALWPEDERARADISRWLCWGLCHWGPACGIYNWENLMKKVRNLGEPDPGELKRGEERLRRFAAVLDTNLADREYVVGAGLTLADFSLAASLTYAQPAKIPLDDYPNIRRWHAAVGRIDAWKRTAPPNLA
jgi:glutathione S-transferase